MGLLSLGTPLPWDEAKKYADHVRTHGITQFLHTWDRLKGREGDELLWGDEVCQHDDVRTCCVLIIYYSTVRLNIWWYRLTMPRRTLNYLCVKQKSWASSVASAMTYLISQNISELLLYYFCVIMFTPKCTESPSPPSIQNTEGTCLNRPRAVPIQVL